MAQVDCIRTLRYHEGKSISEISRIMEIDWRTAKKFADGTPEPPGERPRQQRKRPVMGPYEELVDGWLEEDLRAPAKQRRTARTIFRALKTNHGFKGSERTVNRYVRERRQTLRARQQERFHRLQHPPGTAQVDFGTVWVLDPEQGRRLEMQLLVVSFPYSNAVFAMLLPAENSECFLFGLQSIFQRAGGVPERIWFDNLSAAVKLIQGERHVSEAFSCFRWHYRFETAFCNPAKGNEKGHVENQVGYVRRNYLTPLQVASDLETLNEELNKTLEADRNRPHYRKGTTIAQLWEEDRAALRPLPTATYEICRTLTARANTLGEIQVNGEVYHVAQAVPRQQVFVKLYWDRLEVFDAYGEQRLAELPRTYIPRREHSIDWAAELRPFLRKPRAVEHATYLQALPAVVRGFVIAAEKAERPARLKALIDLFETGYGVEQVTGAVRLALETGRLDTASLKTLAGYQAAMKTGTRPFQEPHTPEAVRSWQPQLGVYDLLAAGSEGR